jgi:para-nitrobenzyl esterase
MRTSLGIRYATAARFAAPVLRDDVNGGGGFGPSAPQPSGAAYVNPVPGMDVGPTDEDCLFLNVWAPDTAAPAPVMVWVHGGAFVTGGARVPTFDGTRLAEQGVVVVTLNYRLGALGFLGGNWGLLDVVAALRWVRTHIASFGGDPSRVTVFGESAGANAILHLFGMPAARGLFQRAIVQSPGAQVHDGETAAIVHAAFTRALGTDPLAASVDDVLATQDAVATELGGAAGPMPWAAFVDGVTVEATPIDAIEAGAAVGVPVMIGTTAEEMRLFARRSFDALSREQLTDVMAASLASALLIDVDRAALDVFVATYGNLTGGDLFTAVLTDAQIGAPMLRVADALARHEPATYAYSFDWRAPRVGAGHEIELPFVFGTIERAGWAEFLAVDDDARRLSQDTMTTWAAFATTGDPASERVGPFPRYTPSERTTRVLARRNSLAPAPSAAALAHVLGHPRRPVLDPG